MIIDIRTVPAGHSVVTQTTDLGELKEEVPPFSEKISCRAEIDRSGQVLYIHVLFHGVFELECSRCLNHYNYPIDGDLRLIVKEQPAKQGSALEDETVDIYYDSRHSQVDVQPAIYEEIMTAIPLKPLCSQDCKGIEMASKPKQAGAAQSSRTKDDIDPRWEALRQLKKDTGKKTK